MASCLEEKTTAEEKTTKWNCMMQKEETCQKWSSGILSIRLFKFFRAFAFFFSSHFHIRQKTKLWGQKNCPQSPEAGLCRGADLVTFTENVSLQENGVCRRSEMEEAWNNQNFSHRWLSDQTEQSEERGLEINPVKHHKTPLSEELSHCEHHVWRKPGSSLCLHHPYGGA